MIVTHARFAKAIPKTLILDVDETLLGWAEPFKRWMFRRGHDAVGPGCVTYNGLSRYEIMRLIEIFNLSEHFGGLKPMPGAIEAVAALQDSGKFEKTVVLSACGVHPTTQLHRLLNLSRFFVFDEFYAIPLEASKEDHFRRLSRGVVIDDKQHHVDAGTTAGHSSHLIDPVNGRGWYTILKEIVEQ